MLINLFGQPFRQTGIIVKANILTATDGDNITISPDGVGGSFVAAAQAPSSAGVALIPTTDLSPISNSNLACLRETIATTAGIRLVSSIAVLRWKRFNGERSRTALTGYWFSSLIPPVLRTYFQQFQSVGCFQEQACIIHYAIGRTQSWFPTVSEKYALIYHTECSTDTAAMQKSLTFGRL